MRSRQVIGVATAAGVLTLGAGVVSAHAGGLWGAQPDRLEIPTWLFLSTGGGLVVASFLVSSFITDRRLLEYIHSRKLSLPSRSLDLRVVGLGALGRVVGLEALGRVVGLAVLGFVLIAGMFGPREPTQNAAVLIVWGGWWAGYTITSYGVANTWPAINPFRTLASPFEAVRVPYPSRLGAWPSVGGLLVIIWLEVTTPVADDPRFLAGILLGYTVLTVSGAAIFGAHAWFKRVDPIANVFRLFGTMAPIQRVDGELRIRLPGSALVDVHTLDVTEIGFVVALVWGTTFDGFVRTPQWVAFASTATDVGVPIWFLYPSVLLTGFLSFLVLFWFAVLLAQRFAPTVRPRAEVATSFAPALLPIAAGLHVAHNLGSFVAIVPALLEAILQPLQRGQSVVVVLPDWYGALAIGFILLGHLLAVWIAHGVACRRFPGRLQAIRSQYPITAVMVVYTVVSLWIATQPVVEPPIR